MDGWVGGWVDGVLDRRPVSNESEKSMLISKFENMLGV